MVRQDHWHHNVRSTECSQAPEKDRNWGDKWALGEQEVFSSPVGHICVCFPHWGTHQRKYIQFLSLPLYALWKSGYSLDIGVWWMNSEVRARLRKPVEYFKWQDGNFWNIRMAKVQKQRCPARKDWTHPKVAPTHTHTPKVAHRKKLNRDMRQWQSAGLKECSSEPQASDQGPQEPLTDGLGKRKGP